jgi:hypothetical protein
MRNKVIEIYGSDLSQFESAKSILETVHLLNVIERAAILNLLDWYNKPDRFPTLLSDEEFIELKKKINTFCAYEKR